MFRRNGDAVLSILRDFSLEEDGMTDLERYAMKWLRIKDSPMPKTGEYILVLTDTHYPGTAYWGESHYGDKRWCGAPGDDLYWDERDLEYWAKIKFP
jgi:hypothetical protein